MMALLSAVMTNLLVADETKFKVAPATIFCQDRFMSNRFNLEEFLPFRLNVLAQSVSEQLSEIYAKRFNLDIPQWRILANLASRGEMTAQEVVVATLSHKSTISRAVTELETRKLIERTTSAKDKRAFAMVLTPKGQKLFAQLLPLVLEFEQGLLNRLAASEKKKLKDVLAALEREIILSSKLKSKTE
jgi:DNA-binding MarR family transcriptional regulator